MSVGEDAEKLGPLLFAGGGNGHTENSSAFPKKLHVALLRAPAVPLLRAQGTCTELAQILAHDVYCRVYSRERTTTT